MTDTQRKKRNFRARKIWKLFKLKKKKECGGIDEITLHKLSKRWELHHEDLREENYEVLNDNFLPCNNKTHDVIHWLWRYYVDDPAIIDRLKAELEKMKEINKGGKECELEKVNKAENKV